MAKYYCKHCGKTLKRDSTKKWVKSYCSKSGKDVHLMKVVDEAHIRR
jgi:ribosomal protein L37AE/L43A